MRKKIAVALTAGVAAATVGFGATGAVEARPAGAGDGGKPSGITCQQFGHSVLRSFGSPAKASLELTTLPLNAVLQLHRESPDVAAGVLIGLGVDEDAVIAACGEPAPA